MPGQSLKSNGTDTETTSSPPEATTSEHGGQSAYGNSFIQEQLKGSDAYAAFLGRTLGPKLYEKISDQLDDASLIKRANDIVDMGIDALRDQVDSQINPDQKASAGQFYNALDKAISDVVKDSIVEGQMGNNVRQFVDTNPELVTSALIAGAVAYIVTNQDLPTLSKKFSGKAGELNTSIDLGSTLNIAVERIETKYRYAGDANTFQVSGAFEPQQGDWNVQGSFDHQFDEGQNLTLSGLQAVSGDNVRQRLGLDYKNGPWKTGGAYERNIDGDNNQIDAASAYLMYNNAQTAAHLRGTVRSDDSWDTSLGLSQTSGDRSWGVEGYANQPAGADATNYGGRVFFKLSF